MDAAYNLICEHSYGAVTIDAICERASVKKGSFYYFFTSKSDLAIAAINAWWSERQVILREIFRPEAAPLERLSEYMKFIEKIQLRSYETTGQVLGCPLHALGTEICNQDDQIKELIQNIVRSFRSYFDQAIHDAQALGQVEGTDVAQKTRILMSYYAGILTQARIENNPGALGTMNVDALAIIGAKPTAAAPFATDLLPAIKRLGLPAQLAPFS